MTDTGIEVSSLGLHDYVIYILCLKMIPTFPPGKFKGKPLGE